jgi:hypothetical protein
MAKDFLNVIERALMMGISDSMNRDTASNNDIYVYGEFPETEDIKFPAIVVSQTGSGFQEQLMGQSMSFDSNVGKGEIYGISFTVHLIVDKETVISVTGSSEPYKQRRLLNWLMLNVANAVLDIDWDVYKEESLEVMERNLQAFRNIGYIPEIQYYGASADFLLTFKNYRS